jgi:pilus assembly protein FimV
VNNQAKFKLSVLAVAMLCSANVWAGLGRINVRSYLGETFHADIELTGVRASELETARIGLASPDTFRDLNVDYSGSMSALRFHVVPSARGAVIRVSSATPINDPYLRFVVEAKTSSGRSVREYTVLLDPPAITHHKPSPSCRTCRSMPRTIFPVAMPASRPRPVML